MNLQQVKPGFVLTLPTAMWPQSDTNVRAKPGEIIDIDVPGEAELIAGQHYKLQPAPEGSTPTLSAIKIPRIAVFLREAAAKAEAAQPTPGAPVHEQQPAAAAAPAPPTPPIKHPRPPAQQALPTVDPLPRVPSKS